MATGNPAGGLLQQRRELPVGPRDVALEVLRASKIASQARGAQLGVRRRIEQPSPALRPERRDRLGHPAGRPRPQRPRRRLASGERRGTEEHGFGRSAIRASARSRERAAPRAPRTAR